MSSFPINESRAQNSEERKDEMNQINSHTSSEAHTEHNSPWPILVALGLGFLPFGFVIYLWGNKIGLGFMIFGVAAALVFLMGWAHSLIREKLLQMEGVAREHWLKIGMKFFLVSEAAIFGALFAHHYYSRVHSLIWPPAGAPELETRLPAIATLLLMTSSGTAQWAHSAFLKGKRLLAQRALLLTIVLGIIFLSIQAYEWGFLKAYDEFTLKNGTFGTSFFMMTGFHGMHVSIGIVLLSIVYFRLLLGHFEPQRHFSFIAASWYWHFVDIVWIFLFGTIYLV